MPDYDVPVIDGGPDDLVDHPERYQLVDLTGAAWAMHTIARAQARLGRLAVHRDTEMQRVARWHDDHAAGLQRAVAAARSLVESYARAARETGVKTIDTPWGRAQTRSRGVVYQYDEAEVGDRLIAADPVASKILATLDELPDWLKVTVRLDTVAFRAMLAEGPDGTAVHRETGEVIEGVLVVHPAPSVSITTDKVYVDTPVAHPVTGIAPRSEEQIQRNTIGPIQP